MKQFCLGFITLFLLGSSLQARELRTFFVQPPKGTPEKAYLVNAKKAIEITLPSRTLSPEIEVPNGELVFAVLPRPLAEGEEIPKQAPRVKIPESWSRCYLLFAYDKSNRFFPVQVIPINASGSDFPVGHSRMLNATSKSTVEARFAKEMVRLKPGQGKLIKPPMSKAGSYEVEIRSKKPDVERPSILCQSKWVHEPAARQLILAVDVPGQTKPRVFALSDLKQKKDK